MTRLNPLILALLFVPLVGAPGVVSLGAQEAPLAPTTVKAEDLLPSPGEAPPPPDAPVDAPDVRVDLPAGAAADAAPGPGDIRVRAEHQEGAEGHYKARGFVDLRFGDTRIQCDALDIDETEGPGGTKAQRLVAVGNVVFLRGEERLAGDRLEMDVETGVGVMENASGYVQPGVFVEAKRIERQGEKRYRIERGRFTACAQPNPRWRISLRSADLRLEDKVIARSAVLRVKSVPIAWLPIMTYPLDRDERSTGFLFPHFGTSSFKGTNVGGGFFWAMGRSYDQTLYADYFSKVGYGFGHEFRYAGPSPSRANFTTYVYNPKSEAERDWDIRWNAVKLLPGRVRLTVNVKQFSNLAFQRFYQDGFNRATTRTQRGMLSLQRVFKAGTLLFTADRMDTYFGDQTRRRQRMPAVSFRQYPKKLGRSGLVFGYDVTADSLGSGYEDSLEMHQRLEIAPQLSRPIQASFLELNPRVSYRLTRYSDTFIANESGATVLEGPGRTRPVFETGVDLRGPNFSRVFQSPWGGFSDRLKHVVGPEMSWTHRTRVDDFDTIPKYDGTDYLLGTSQVDYGIVQQLFARRRAPNGKLIPYELFSWRVHQTYYLKISESQGTYDPNYSSAAYGPGYVPAHRSALVSRMRLRPRPGWSADMNLEYNVNFDQFRTVGLATTLGGERAALQAAWTQVNQLSEVKELREAQSSMLRGSGRVGKLPGGLSLEGSVDYDFARETLYHATARIKWDVQCCGFVAEAVRTNWGGVSDWEFRFSLSLANVGNMPAFMGMDSERRQGSLGGQR